MTVCPRCGAATKGSERTCRVCGSSVPAAVSLVKSGEDPLGSIRLEKPAPPPGPWSATVPAPPPATAPAIADEVRIVGPSRASRRAAVVIVVAVASGVATVAGFAGSIRSFGEAVIGALPGGTTTAAAMRPVGPSRPSAAPQAGAASAAPQVVATAAPFTAALTRSQLRALLLGPADLPSGSGVGVDPSVPARAVSLHDYEAGYRQSMTPATCERAKGLLLFSDASPVVAGGPVIRSDGLLLDGGDGGSQQVRRFATEAGAIEFMQQQRAWFGDCGTTTYRWPGRSIDFDGAVFDDRAPDTLLASAIDTDSSTGTHPEFDGWARVGPVVYGAYLTGGADTDRGDLEEAGRAVLAAAQRRLIAAG